MSDPCDSTDSFIAWQALIRAANTAFEQQHDEVAIGLYRRALVRAEAVPLDAPDHALALRAISRLNLVEALDRAGHIADASHELMTLHAQLLGLATDPAAPDELRAAARCHGERCRLELLHFARRHAGSDIARLMAAAPFPFHPN